MKQRIEYFYEILNTQNISELKVPSTKDDEQMLPSPRMEETVRVTPSLKKHKSAGANRLQSSSLNMKLTKYTERRWTTQGLGQRIIA